MKKAYIFSLDVFVAAIILIVGIIAIISFVAYSPEVERTDKLATEIVNIMATIKLNEVCDFSSGCSCVYSSIDTLCPYIKNERISMLEFLGQLYHDKIDKSYTAAVIDEVFIAPEIIPPNFDIQIILYDPILDAQMQLYPN